MKEDSDVMTLDMGGDKIFVIKISNFEHEVDPEDILRIDHSNIMGEILTFSLILNRVGNMKAFIDNTVLHSKMDLEIFEAQLAELFRLEASQDINKVKKITEKEIENKVLTDDQFYKRKKQYLDLLKQQSYIDSFYWSVKDKSDKLIKLSEKLRPEDFEKELIEDTINGIIIKQRTKHIK